MRTVPLQSKTPRPWVAELEVHTHSVCVNVTAAAHFCLSRHGSWENHLKCFSIPGVSLLLQTRAKQSLFFYFICRQNQQVCFKGDRSFYHVFPGVCFFDNSHLLNGYVLSITALQRWVPLLICLIFMY